MNIFRDIYGFFTYLSFVDIIFLTAIVVLLILIVVLIYFIRINRDVLGEDDLFPDNDKKDILKLKKENDNKSEINDFKDDEEPELIDLVGLTKKLEEEQENNKKNDTIKFTDYEKDQEEKAIISYDELLKKHNKYAINYEDEKIVDDLVIKKVNLNDLENKNKEENCENVRVISYSKEEAFLSALKELNSLLN